MTGAKKICTFGAFVKTAVTGLLLLTAPSSAIGDSLEDSLKTAKVDQPTSVLASLNLPQEESKARRVGAALKICSLLDDAFEEFAEELLVPATQPETPTWSKLAASFEVKPPHSDGERQVLDWRSGIGKRALPPIDLATPAITLNR